MKALQANTIFKKSISDYHRTNSVDAKPENLYPPNTIEYLLYLKNWIDTVQWHLEDIIRSPAIAPENLVAVKRRIDASNQERTDIVEKIDDYLLDFFKNTVRNADAQLNSETPAWLLDRMSI
ncbi:MAG: DUF4254 domain-containing protein, partial [Verrucomicrobia bacterium]|nr:DUF4254 domain-containing protein [Cytophagales bacterium]